MVEAGWSPSVRLFEAAACGCPIISDRWQGLTELLPEDTAILIADTAEDVVTVLTGLDHTRRVEIGARAQEIVLRSHTGIARAEAFLRAMRLADERPARAAGREKPAWETTPL
jgi:spore maturation protein CgeB